MKPECSATKLKMFCILHVISLFTVNKKTTTSEHYLNGLVPYFLSGVVQWLSSKVSGLMFIRLNTELDLLALRN